jgi:hypothetical protein
MTNAIKVLLQMPSGFLQLESTLLCVMLHKFQWGIAIMASGRGKEIID